MALVALCCSVAAGTGCSASEAPQGEQAEAITQKLGLPTKSKIRFDGEVVDTLPTGEEIRRYWILKDGRRMVWRRKVENSVAAPEPDEKDLPATSDRPIEPSLDELAENLRALRLYAGHEFIDEFPRYDLAEAALAKGESRLLGPGNQAEAGGEAIRKVRQNIPVGEDTRAIANNVNFPYRSQILLDNVTSPGGALVNGAGTATLIGASTAVSAAHVFWDEGNNTWEAAFSWAPGHDRSDSPPDQFGQFYQCYWVSIPSAFTANPLPATQYDIAVIDFNVGCNWTDGGTNSDHPGWAVGGLGRWILPPVTSTLSYVVSGYPAGTCANAPCNNRLWTGGATGVNLVDSNTTYCHSADTSSGQSGAAVYTTVNNFQYVIGIHYGAHGSCPQKNRARYYDYTVENFVAANTSEW